MKRVIKAAEDKEIFDEAVYARIAKVLDNLDKYQSKVDRIADATIQYYRDEDEAWFEDVRKDIYTQLREFVSKTAGVDYLNYYLGDDNYDRLYEISADLAEKFADKYGVELLDEGDDIIETLGDDFADIDLTDAKLFVGDVEFKLIKILQKFKSTSPTFHCICETQESKDLIHRWVECNRSVHDNPDNIEPVYDTNYYRYYLDKYGLDPSTFHTAEGTYDFLADAIIETANSTLMVKNASPYLPKSGPKSHVIFYGRLVR